MSKTLIIREMKLGEGIPKVCVPITGKTKEAIIQEAVLAKEAGADLIEWRADHYMDGKNPEKTVEMSQELRNCVGEMPILFTYRTEGCESSILEEDYMALNRRMADAKTVDLIDIELFMGEELCSEFCDYAHERGVYVIISNHDFEGTPEKTAIIERLRKMQSLGADIPKIAVMPNGVEDVLTLLGATSQYVEMYAKGPVITMSMQWLGGISRISGEVFGSALTFGSTVRTSAPGQLAMKDLKYMLEVLHKPEN